MASSDHPVRYDDILENSDEALACFDEGDRYTYLNREAERLLGVSRNDVLGKVVWEVWPYPVNSLFQRAFKRAALERTTVYFEDYYPFQQKWLATRCFPSSDNGVYVYFRDITEQKNAEDALNYQEELRSKVLDNINGFVCVLSPDGAMLYANRLPLEMSGLELPDIFGKPITQAPWWSDCEDTRSLIKSAYQQAASGERVRFDINMQATEKKCIELDLSVSPVFDKHNHVTHVVLSGVEITDRKIAERHFIALAENNPDFIVRIDKDKKYTFANKAITNLVRLAPEEIVGKHVTEVKLPKPLDDICKERLDIVLSTGQKELFDFTYTVDNHEHFIVARLVPETDETGEIVSALCIGQDITRLKDVEYALRNQLELIQAILENAADAIFTLDAMGCVSYANPAAEIMFGWSKDELVGKSLISLIHIPDEIDDSNHISIISIIQSAQTIRNHEEIFNHRKGKHIPVSCSNAPIMSDGKLIGSVLIVQDITERKQMQQSLQAEYEREHYIAETLQRSLLSKPSSNAYEGVTIETFYVPAYEDTLVGGDFYDIFTLTPQNRIALAVGDVTGKGLQAASYTAEIKYALRAILHDSPHPARALERLNAYLMSEPARNPYTIDALLSLNLVSIDTYTGDLFCAVAGAEPPLILRSNGTLDIVPASGLLIGADLAVGYRQFSDKLDPGDIIIMATDGITESRMGRELFGLEGLILAAKEAHKRSVGLTAMGSSIIQYARDFAKGLLQDDVCLLLARREESPIA